MSNSVQTHRRQPTRLCRPWDSPGKNTGVGCHFLLQCMKVKSKTEVTQSCLTLRDPLDWNLPGSSVHGIFQAIISTWLILNPLLSTLQIQCFNWLLNNPMTCVTCLYLFIWTLGILRQTLSNAFINSIYSMSTTVPKSSDCAQNGMAYMLVPFKNIKLAQGLSSSLT